MPSRVKLSSSLTQLLVTEFLITEIIGEAGFTCGVCNKNFISVELLQHHSRVHQVEDLSSICRGQMKHKHTILHQTIGIFQNAAGTWKLITIHCSPANA